MLLNGSVIRRGGGVQACAAFVRQLVDGGMAGSWHFALSDVLVSELAGLGVALPSARTEVFAESPARSLVARRRLVGLERSLKPGLVFTFFGPAYVRFSRHHLCGVADGWVTHADALAYSTLGSWQARQRMRLLCAYKAHWLKAADEWVVEAEVARAGLAGRLGISPGRVHVIANSCAPHYLSAAHATPLLPTVPQVRALCFCEDYPHKNLSLVPQVARILLDRPDLRRIELLLTLPRGGEGERRILGAARTLGVAEAVRNLGSVPLEHGPALYRSCDLLFHPSLLETFPATYPEAMAMGVPIVTSDLPFARGICGDGALYFKPGDPQAASDAIVAAVAQESVRQRLIAAGRARLGSLGLPGEKQRRLLALVDDFAARRGLVP